MQKLLLFGAGLHALSCLEIIEKQAEFEVLGFIDSLKTIGEVIAGYPVLGNHSDILRVVEKHQIKYGFIAIGDNWSRFQVFKEISALLPDLHFINAIHPNVELGKDTKIGHGNVIAAGCIISPGTQIGNFCLLSNGVKLGLMNTLEDFSSVSVGSITGGMVWLHEWVAITLGVTIMDRIEIGQHTVVGAGSLVNKSLPDFVLVYGHPAKIMNKRKPGDAYLRSGTDIRPMI